MPHETHENIIGKITRLFVNRSRCNIRIDGHGNRYFELDLTHPNYDAIYTLLVDSAKNRYTVRLRLEDYQPPEPPSSKVQYIVLDWS